MQNRINKILILLTIFSHTLFGCALCTLYSPETLVSIDVEADKNNIKEAKVLWVLTKEFTEQLKQIYDQNQNNYLDKDELQPIKQSLLDYVVPKDYLTHISYDKVINKEKSNKIEVKENRVFVKNSRLHFEYTINLNYKVIKDNVLYIHINDDESYFILLLAKNTINFNGLDEVSSVKNKQSVAFYINTQAEQKDIKKEPKNETASSTSNSTQTLLTTYTKKIKEYLVKIDKGDNIALFTLLLISFIYGIVHAIGPGHGKSLAFSYFLANKSSYVKAFFISQASAFIHIVGALILVVVSVFILESFLNNFVKDSVSILTKVSALLIIMLSIFIFHNKVKKKGCSCSSCCASSSSPTNQMWSTSPVNKTQKLKPNFMKKDLYFVLTAGLIPCPGTVVLFIYAFVLKTYFAVLLASIFISLGMGLVIFASSFLGVSLKKASASSHKLTNFFEILAPVIMFLLGILLFISSSNI